MPDMITVPEAALRLGISRIAVYQAIREGRLPASTVLGRIALDPADVAAYRTSTPTPHAPTTAPAPPTPTPTAKPTRGGNLPVPARREPVQQTLLTNEEEEDWDRYL